MLLGKFKIIGHSMEPVLLNNNIVLVSSLFYTFKSPQINDIVAFRYKNKVYIKRIKKIINEKYQLLGDNSKDSLDSKTLGLIFKKDILGKYFYKLK